MGKRKSSKKPQVRVKQVLDKSFRCVFCAHQGSVTCKLDTKNHIGRLACKDCGQSFEADINHLTEPVDLYSQWIDACEAVNPVNAPPQRAKSAQAAPKKRRAADDEEDADEEDEDDGQNRGGAGGRTGLTDDEEEEDLPDLRAVHKKQRVDSPGADEEDDAGGAGEDADD
ncbi:transcription elongation factor 1 family protein [Rhodotorula paludigena]|uniref:transcription elongation factor 1 family protein n=1 Tax=Rhodotorula paludigena TaxID=86838 RepID=UPI00318114E9